MKDFAIVDLASGQIERIDLRESLGAVSKGKKAVLVPNDQAIDATCIWDGKRFLDKGSVPRLRERSATKETDG